MIDTFFLFLLQIMKTMNRLLIIFIFTFACQPLFAQTGSRVAKSIKGKVIDEVTNQAVVYANIGIEGTFYGTASDAEGNFEMKIPEEMIDKQIFFSALSYITETFPVNRLFEKEYNIIKLKPQTYSIADVDIEARSRVIIRILRMASENTPYNFLGGPFNLSCTYENDKIVNDTVNISETAKVLVYDGNGYRQPSKTDAFNMRKYEIKKEEPDYSFATGITNFDELLELDWVRSATSVLNPAILNQFDLAMEDETTVEDKPAWVISFTQKQPAPSGSHDFHATAFKGKITVSKDDYSVKKIEGEGFAEKQNRQGNFLAVGRGNNNYFEDVNYSFEITYSKLKPETFLLNKKYRFKEDKITETASLTVDQVLTSGVKSISSRQYFPR